MENEGMVSPKKNNTFKDFLKKYSYYLVLAVLILILAVTIIVTSVFANKSNKPKPASAEALSFQSPVLNGTILKEYNDSELQFNSALGLWEVHKGVDYAADIGTNVLAAYNGTVTKVSTDLLKGTVVEIDHGNNLKTTYGSLSQDVLVKVGDLVNQGDIIGKASNTATNETTDSGEVHFEVWKDGNLVDPAGYMDVNGK